MPDSIWASRIDRPAPDGSDGSRDRILVVDDEAKQRELVVRVLSERYECTPVANATQARKALLDRDFELALCDVSMPGENGIDLIKDLVTDYPELAITMVTAVDDDELAERALEQGAYGYIVKPFRATELRIGVANALRRRRLELAARQQVEGLRDNLLDRATTLTDALSELEHSHAELEASRLETLQRLSLAVEARDQMTSTHVNGMVSMVEAFAARAGEEPHDARSIGIASAMHDVGKIGVPDRILLKPGPLTDEERKVMQRHAEVGCHILDGSPNKLLRLAASIAHCHHEQFDGSGYPRALRGEEIPREARIVQIVDVFSALTADRPYRRALSVDQAVVMIGDGAGTQFDPQLATKFVSVHREVIEAAAKRHSVVGSSS